MKLVCGLDVHKWNINIKFYWLIVYIVGKFIISK